MIFTITSMNKEFDMYTVVSDTNEQKTVSGAQIIGVMCNGYVFSNAKLTNKGFAVVTTKGTRYIQVSMNKAMQTMVQNKIRELAALEEAKKAQMSKAVNSPVSTLVGKKYTQQNKEYKPVNVKQKIENKKPTFNRIIFRGKHYFSAKAICKDFGADVEVFMLRYSKGYPIGQCLGIEPLFNDKELKDFKEAQMKVSIAMSRERGEF